MEPTSLPDAPATPAAEELTIPALPETEVSGSNRRDFIKGIAAAGASTGMAAVALDAAGVSTFFGDDAVAADAMPFSEFQAIAASSADALEVPAGYRADVIIKYGDAFANTDGTVYTYGYNNDWLGFFPLNGSNDEGLLAANHEYPSPFFQNGYKQIGLANGDQTKSNAEIFEEMESVGFSIVHIKKDSEGAFKVVSPSRYNRRIFGGDIEFNAPETSLVFSRDVLELQLLTADPALSRYLEHYADEQLERLAPGNDLHPSVKRRSSCASAPAPPTSTTSPARWP